ncbi:hypothetical protein [Magnetospirillum aberrantis]|uniref:Competence protein CoiA nuclease-like domain-containing protein n=1 Tax=Magnetospirillum aberrantis SpK TaxID=908842 RepID=A0A7C9QWI1_9PROT|nr:hypothetical protein [Magnetospirillum aberrantis]NFV80976.1 hypothetical protein [Magnetospirillum aberrantis SpK]
MPQTAFHGDDLLVAADITDPLQWERVRKWSKTNQLLTSCCRTRATAVQNENGFRFFRHHTAPKNCEAGKESIEHEKLKAEAYLVAKRCGYLAQMEASGPNWRADVLVTHPVTGEQSAIEIQKSDQKNHETRERVERHNASGVRSVWFFLRKQDYEEVPPDLIGQGLPAFLLREKSTEERIRELGGLLTALLKGSMVYDKGSDLAKVPLALIGYNYPCGHCGQQWFRTTFAVAYPNRVRGGNKPMAIPLAEASFGEQALSKLRQLTQLTPGKTLKVAPNVEQNLICPHCGAMPDREFLTEDVALQCPYPNFVGAIDIRQHLGFKPGWRKVRPPEPEATMPVQQWQQIIQERLRNITDERERQAQERERQRIVREEQARRRREQRTEELCKRELSALEHRLTPLMSGTEITTWLNQPSQDLAGLCPISSIREHANKHWQEPSAPQSEPVRIISSIADGSLQNNAGILGLTEEQQLLILRNSRHQRRAQRLASAENFGSKVTAFGGLLIGAAIDKIRFRAKK